MSICRFCASEITSHYDRWVHLHNEQNTHRPEPLVGHRWHNRGEAA